MKSELWGLDWGGVKAWGRIPDRGGAKAGKGVLTGVEPKLGWSQDWRKPVQVRGFLSPPPRSHPPTLTPALLERLRQWLWPAVEVVRALSPFTSFHS